MSEIAEKIRLAVATLAETRGTPYQANAEMALAALCRRARGEDPAPMDAVQRAMRRAVQDARHARDGEMPAGRHPWRGYMSAECRRPGEAGLASGGVLASLAVVGLSSLFALLAIALLIAVGYRLLPRSDEHGAAVARAEWRRRRRELRAEAQARRVRP
jgi:hypothetical protein